VKEGLSWGYDRKRKTHDIRPETFKKRVLEEIKAFNGKLGQELKENSRVNIQAREAEAFFRQASREPSLFWEKLSTKPAKKTLSKAGRTAQTIPAVLIIDSHLSHLTPPSKVDWCLITTTSLAALNRRLKKRGYNAIKIKENLEAEAFETCKIEALEGGHRSIVLKTG